MHIINELKLTCTVHGRPPKHSVLFGGRSAACKAARKHQVAVQAQVQQQQNQTPGFDRRRVLLSMPSAVIILAHCRPSQAVPLVSFRDERDSFEISVPEGWSMSQASSIQGTGPTAARRTMAWYEDGKPSTYVTVTVNNVGADYTSLGSFGTAEQFGTALVASMDQSFLKRAPKWARQNGQVPQEVTLVAAKESDKTYNIEYTIKRDQEEQRHLISTVALGYNGRYTRLYTVTAQCFEPQLQGEKATLKSILESFKPPNPRV